MVQSFLSGKGPERELLGLIGAFAGYEIPYAIKVSIPVLSGKEGEHKILNTIGDYVGPIILRYTRLQFTVKRDGHLGRISVLRKSPGFGLSRHRFTAKHWLEVRTKTNNQLWANRWFRLLRNSTQMGICHHGRDKMRDVMDSVENVSNDLRGPIVNYVLRAKKYKFWA